MKILKRFVFLLLVLVLTAGIRYTWSALPIISAYSAKNMCSCVMLSGRQPDDVRADELGSFPLSLGAVEVNYTDSSATGSVFGLAERKAIFRKGLGCTLVSEITEEELRSQKIRIATTPPPEPDTATWLTRLTDNVSPSVAFPDIDTARLRRLLDTAFTEPGPKPLRRTRAIVIVYKGKVVAERYAEGYDRHTMLTGWSMSKSITNALVGILVKAGKLQLHAPAPVTAWREDARRKITLHHLMQASSGLEWEEVYAGPSTATSMLFLKGNAASFAARSPLRHEPGTNFYYSSGTTNIISRIIRDATGDSLYYRLPYEQLFYRIGMHRTLMEPDASGTFVGSSFTFGTARDWARFGLLFLHDGVWNGERILPEGWVTYTTTPAPAAELGEYGAQFWLNRGAPGNPSCRLLPDLPTDLYWADGYEGQNVFVLPSKDLVVVKLSQSTGNYLDDVMFLKEIIASIGRQGASVGGAP